VAAGTQALAIAASATPAAPPAVRRRDATGLRIALVFVAILTAARLIDVSEDGPAMLLFGMSYTAVVASVAVLRPRWFPVLACAYLPFSRAYSVGLAIPGANMINLLIVFGMVAAISARYTRRVRRRFPSAVPLVFGYIVLGALSLYPTLTSGEFGIGETVQLYRSWVAPIVFFLVVLATVRDRQDMADVIEVMAWTAMSVGALTWIEGIGRQDRGTIDASRVSGLMRQANSMGAFLVYYGVPLLALALMTRSWRRRALYLAGFLVTARAMLFTFSRGAYLGFAAGSALVVLLRSPLLLLAGAGGGALTVAAFPSLIPSSVVERFGDTTSDEKGLYDPGALEQLDRSSAHRLVLWRGAVRMIAQQPLQGVGLGLFQLRIGNYTEVPLQRDDPRDAHNAFILIASEMGIPMLLLLLVLHCCFAALAFRLYFRRRMLVDRTLALAFLGCQVGVIVSCMLGSRFSDEALIAYFWMMAGMLCVTSALPQALPARKRRAGARGAAPSGLRPVALTH
jgi:putative inorganic carbon (HCO3(-)) transporter